MSHASPIRLSVFSIHENQQAPSEVRLQPHPMHGFGSYVCVAFGLFVLMELLHWIFHKMGIYDLKFSS